MPLGCASRMFHGKRREWLLPRGNGAMHCFGANVVVGLLWWKRQLLFCGANAAYHGQRRRFRKRCAVAVVRSSGPV